MDYAYQLQNHYGLQLPPNFSEQFNAFISLVDSAGFHQYFARARVCTDEDVERAHQSNLSADLFPFMLEQHDFIIDYYCFTLAQKRIDNKIVTFSEHAIVASWNDFHQFNTWLKSQINIQD